MLSLETRPLRRLRTPISSESLRILWPTKLTLIAGECELPYPKRR